MDNKTMHLTTGRDYKEIPTALELALQRTADVRAEPIPSKMDMLQYIRSEGFSIKELDWLIGSNNLIDAYRSAVSAGDCFDKNEYLAQVQPNAFVRNNDPFFLYTRTGTLGPDEGLPTNYQPKIITVPMDHFRKHKGAYAAAASFLLALGVAEGVISCGHGDHQDTKKGDKPTLTLDTTIVDTSAHKATEPVVTPVYSARTMEERILSALANTANISTHAWIYRDTTYIGGGEGSGDKVVPPIPVVNILVGYEVTSISPVDNDTVSIAMGDYSERDGSIPAYGEFVLDRNGIDYASIIFSNPPPRIPDSIHTKEDGRGIYSREDRGRIWIVFEDENACPPRYSEDGKTNPMGYLGSILDPLNARFSRELANPNSDLARAVALSLRTRLRDIQCYDGDCSGSSGGEAGFVQF